MTGTGGNLEQPAVDLARLEIADSRVVQFHLAGERRDVLFFVRLELELLAPANEDFLAGPIRKLASHPSRPLGEELAESPLPMDR